MNIWTENICKGSLPYADHLNQCYSPGPGKHECLSAKHGADESATCGMRQRTLTISSWLSSRTLILNNKIITQSLRNCCTWKGQDQQCWLNDTNRDGSHKRRTREMIEMIIYTNAPTCQIHAYLFKQTHTHFTMYYYFFGFTCHQEGGMYTLLKAHTHILGWHKVLVLLITKQDMQKHIFMHTGLRKKKKKNSVWSYKQMSLLWYLQGHALVPSVTRI